MKCGFVLWKLRDARPGTFRGCSHETKDLLELVFVGRAGEEGAARVHLRHDAAGGPYVNGGVVGAGAEEDVGRSVPECDDFVGERVDGYAERSRKAKVA